MGINHIPQSMQISRAPGRRSPKAVSMAYSHNLNQSGKKIPETPYSRGDKVYFYQPPSQNEVIKRGRKAKHLMHYRGPATITQPIPGRRRQYEIEFEGKLFKRDVGMLIPQQTMREIDPLTLDVVDCLLYTSPSPRDRTRSRMPSSA